MAYLRELTKECAKFGCDRPASLQLFGSRNEPLDAYCRRHGPQMLDARMKLERSWENEAVGKQG